MQTAEHSLFGLGLIIILVGFLIIVIGATMLWRQSSNEDAEVKESKGIVLIGPIPIVWGFSRRTQIILIFVLLVVFGTIFILSIT